jgi:hypothetical protein
MEANLEYEAAGPEIFIRIVGRFQHNSSSTVRTLIKQLQDMKLAKEPGMTVDNFSTKVSKSFTPLKDTSPEVYLRTCQ